MEKISRKLGFVVILALVMCMSVAAAAEYYFIFDYNGKTVDGQTSTTAKADVLSSSSTDYHGIHGELYRVLPSNVSANPDLINWKLDEYDDSQVSISDGKKNVDKNTSDYFLDNNCFISDNNSKKFVKFLAQWKDNTGEGVVGDLESFISDAIQTVDIFPADEKLAYVQGSGKDVTFFFPEADIEQFSGYGLNFETTAKYNVDYTVSAGENGVFLTLKASYLDTLEKGNNTPILFFTRNNPNPSGGIGLADLTVK